MFKVLLMVSLLQSPAAFEYKDAGGSYSMYPAYENVVSGKNPALLSLSKTSFLQFSGEQPWSMEELGFGSVKAVVPFHKMAFSLSWANFSSNEYRENSLDLIYSITPFSWLSLGAVFNYYNLYIADRNVTTEHFVDGSFHLVIRPFKWLHLSGSIENAATFFDVHNRALNGNFYFSAGILPMKGVSLQWNCQKTIYGFNNIFTLSIALLSSLEITGGYNFESKTVCGGINFIWRNFNASYTLNYHSYLGSTHRFTFSVSLKERSFKGLGIPQKKKKSIKRLNINTCTLKDLLTIPVLNEIMAKRIILYRKKIGPITIKTFSQIGMESKDIQTLMKYIYGIKKIKRNFKSKKYKSQRLFTHKDKKRLFLSLIKSGVSPLKAAQLSQARYKRNYKKVRKIISTIKHKKIQQRALKLCLR